MKILLLICMLLCLISASQRVAVMQDQKAQTQTAQTQTAQSETKKAEGCLLIRQIRYPVTQTNDPKHPQKLKYCLIDVCPDNPGMVARPLIDVGWDESGKPIMKEYDVVKAFKNKTEAQNYAKKNGLPKL